MNYQSVADTAKAWNLSERTVRNYCASGKIPGAVLTGKTWNIPQDAKRPERINKKQQAPRALLDILQDEMIGHVKGGIYHKIQIDLTYNSNHIEGSRLTHDQTRYIYETNTIGMEHGVVNVDDVVETANHFKCIDLIIRDAKKPIREALIKKLHFTLKSGTSDSRKDWFAVGEYKTPERGRRQKHHCPRTGCPADERTFSRIRQLLSKKLGGSVGISLCL